MPAIDALERHPGNNFYPRIVHSLAMQTGREGCLVEAHGGSGWGASPESFTEYVLWLASHGIERFVLYLSQYALSSRAVHDWPPSMPLHLTWKEAFPSVLEGIRKQAEHLPYLRLERPDLLIVTPTRGVMAAFDPRDALAINEHNGDGVPDDTESGRISNRFMALVEACHAAGIRYELSEERAVEEDGTIEDGRLVLGQRSYGRVLLPDGCVWHADSEGHTAPDRLRAAGVTVWAAREAESAAWLGLSERMLLPHSAPATHGEAFVPRQNAWQAVAPASNRMLLDWYREGKEGRLVSAVRADSEAAFKDASLVLLDRPRSLRLNGKTLIPAPFSGELCHRYPLSEADRSRDWRLELEPQPDADPPARSLDRRRVPGTERERL
ncbi:hypothetical protein [Cohnella sp. GbtcB17]|uniref:hypothetical protein n=1 Tax=Cohnella sp. GbtcB17 TaxID=2824762 RepID=UPI001C2FBA8B|nr:hypothetical protein [Cohnella sp. GbtcB17]